MKKVIIRLVILIFMFLLFVPLLKEQTKCYFKMATLLPYQIPWIYRSIKEFFSRSL